MKSVGEVMAIGRTFKEALLKAVRSLEIGRYGLQPMFSRRSAARRGAGHDPAHAPLAELGTPMVYRRGFPRRF